MKIAKLGSLQHSGWTARLHAMFSLAKWRVDSSKIRDLFILKNSDEIYILLTLDCLGWICGECMAVEHFCLLFCEEKRRYEDGISWDVLPDQELAL